MGLNFLYSFVFEFRTHSGARERERESGDPLETGEGFEVKLAIGSLMRYCPVNRERNSW